MKKALYLCLLFLLSAHGLLAQTATGSWYGKAEVELAGMHDNYLTELVLKQKGVRVNGVFGYYFRDKYQSFVVHGNYNPRTREVTILNIPVIYYGSNSTVNSIDCNMDFRGVLMNSKLTTSLSGHFYHGDRYAHMCPDLKVAYTLDRNEKPDSASASAAGSSRIWTPQSDDIVIDATREGLHTDSAKKKLDSLLTIAMSHVDSVKENTDSIETAVVPPKDSAAMSTQAATSMPAATSIPSALQGAPDPVKLEKDDSRKIAESFGKRISVLNKVLEVESDSVRVSFYDNGEIDGDSISVFLNQLLILKHQQLEARALTLYLLLDSTREVNEISMFAENLGKYPPNTALMVVTDGKNRYEVFMSSSLKENATIKLKKKKT